MHKYPKAIIPRPTYKRHLNFTDLLSKYPELLVLRMVKGKKEDFMDASTGELSQNIFNGTVQNLSMNLLGAKYKIKHKAFLPQEPATNEWKGEKVVFSDFKSSYKEENPCFHICFCVKDIHNKTYPFPMTFDKEEDRDKMEKNAKDILQEYRDSIDQDIVGKFVSSKEKVDVQVLMQLNHMPNKLNYWHVTLDTSRPDSSAFIAPEDKLKSRDRKQLKAFKQHLMQIKVFPSSINYCLRRTDYKERVTYIDNILDFINA